MADVIDTLAIDIIANDQFSSVAQRILNVLENMERQLAQTTKQVSENEAELQSLKEQQEELAESLEETIESQEKANKSTKELASSHKESAKAKKKSTKETKESTKANKKAEKQAKSTTKSMQGLVESVVGFTKAFGAITTLIMASTGFDRLATNASKTNHELDNLSKNIGMNRNSLSIWQGASEAMGGSASGMANTLSGLSSALTRFQVMGDASIIPFFNALGVAPLDAMGNIRKLEDIMLELADKFSRMDRGTALAIAQGMGIDDETFNVLVKGRKSLQDEINRQNAIYRSSEKDVENSNKLIKATAILNQQFSALKLRIGNLLAPVLIKITDLIAKFVDKIVNNEDLLKKVITGVSTVFTTLLVPAVLASAGAILSLTASILPSLLLFGSLIGAVGLLYDDYRTWASGGKSLFDWKDFNKWLSESDFSLRNIASSLLFLLTGYKDWDSFVKGGQTWLSLKGFLKDGKVSIDSIREGFKNLANDIVSFVMPLFDRLSEIFKAIGEGRFFGKGGAFALMGEGLGDLKTKLSEYLSDATEGITNRVIGTVEVARGKEPPKSKQKFTGFGKEIDGYIKEASKRYSIDESTLRGLVKMEDGWYGNISPTGATGVGQFTIGTWNWLAKMKEGKEIGMMPVTKANKGTEHDPRKDNRINTLATALLARKNASTLTTNGIDVSGENLYMAHNMGSGFVLAIHGKQAFTEDTRKNMDANGGEGKDAYQFWEYQRDRFNRHYREANSLGIKEAREERAKQEIRNDVPLSSEEERILKENMKKQPANIPNVEVIKESSNKSFSIQKIIDLLKFASNSSSKPLIDTEFANSASFATKNMLNLAHAQPIHNNNKVDMVFNGGIHVTSSSNTLNGTAKDLTGGIENSVKAMQFNYGLS